MSDDILSDHFGHEKHKLKASIMTVATAVFAAQGYYNTSLKLIALSSFQEVGAIFTYFDSKEALLLATLEEAKIRVEEWFLENRPTERKNINYFHRFTTVLGEYCRTSIEGRLLARVTGEAIDVHPKIGRAIEVMAESWTENIYYIVSAFCDVSESTSIASTFLSHLLGAYAMERVYQSDEFILDACLALNNVVLNKERS